MKTIQKVGYSFLASSLLVAQASAQGLNFGWSNVKNEIKGSGETADTAVQALIGNAMLVLAIVAVCYGIYGGFLMLTAGGEEDNMKKGRKILIQVAIGLVVIWLANSVVQFVLKKILGQSS